MSTIDNYDFSGKRALVRVDFNVPLDEQQNITDDTRIKAAIPTLKKVLSGGGSLVIMSHLGRPKNGPEDKFSLRHIVNRLSELVETDVTFADNCINSSFELTKDLSPGKVILLENLRFHNEEKDGNASFANQLAEHGDVYINDAFGTAHRAHASTSIIAENFPQDKMFGYLIENEIKSVDKVLNSDQRPLTAIIGGAKVSSKITIIDQLLDKVDNLIIGGGMAYTFVKAQGGKVGKSLVEEDKLDLARDVLKKAVEKGVNLAIPIDTVIADEFSNNANKNECAINEIPDGWMGLDIGSETVSSYEEIINDSKLILWNGPMGVFEMDNFAEGTKAVAKAITESTQKGAFSLIGGGDSVAAINKYNFSDKVSYVSTGGGAMLEYLEGKQLPGIAAIRK